MYFIGNNSLNSTKTVTLPCFLKKLSIHNTDFQIGGYWINTVKSLKFVLANFHGILNFCLGSLGRTFLYLTPAKGNTTL